MTHQEENAALCFYKTGQNYYPLRVAFEQLLVFFLDRIVFSYSSYEISKQFILRNSSCHYILTQVMWWSPFVVMHVSDVYSYSTVAKSLRCL